MSLSIATPPRELSSFRVLTASHQQCLLSRISRLSIDNVPLPAPITLIRMGGGPRTFPGGVSKWQWKRMQAKKAKQLLKARLCRERQIYEMRKRSELRAAVSELERPWEVVERAPTLFSVRADEQLKVLADRFQRPGGYDLWTERDGPQLFQTADGLSSARFFPKGVVHSIKPYGSIADSSVEEAMGSNFQGSVAESVSEGYVSRVGNRSRKSKKSHKPGERPRSDWKREAGIGDSPTGREEWMTNTEASGTVSERQRSGKFLGDGTGKDSRVVFEKKGHRRSFGSGNSYRSKSEEGTLGAVGREEIRIKNGSYSSPNGRRYNATRTRSFGSGKSYRSKSEEGTLDAFGREEIRINNGSYSSPNGRRSNATRSRSFGSGNSYRSKSEEGTLGAVGREEIRMNNGSYTSANSRSNTSRKRSFGSGNSYRSKSEEGTFGAVGREEIRINNGSYSNANRRSNTNRTLSRSRATHTGDVYNMSLQDDGSYEL